MHLEACLRPSQLFHSSSRTLSRSSCNVCLLWSFHQQFFCYWCVQDRPTEMCHSSLPLVLVYLPVHWVLFLLETVSPQAARCVTFPLVTPSCRLHLSRLRTVAQFLNTDFSYEHHCTFNLCSDLAWIQQRFFLWTSHGSEFVCSLHPSTNVSLTPFSVLLIFVRTFHDCHSFAWDLS